MTCIVDTDVLIDIASDDPIWCDASIRAIRDMADRGPQAINIVIYAEMAAGFQPPASVDRLLDEWRIGIAALFPEAAVLAGRAFRLYRQSGGSRTGVLPDFFIGAQAQAEGWRLLTRDPKRYRSCFPSVDLIVPVR